MAAVFVDFHKNRCNFLHKNKLEHRTADTIPHRAACRMRSFLSGQSLLLPYGSRRLAMVVVVIVVVVIVRYDTIIDAILTCADMSQLNLPHGNNN